VGRTGRATQTCLLKMVANNRLEGGVAKGMARHTREAGQAGVASSGELWPAFLLTAHENRRTAPLLQLWLAEGERRPLAAREGRCSPVALALCRNGRTPFDGLGHGMPEPLAVVLAWAGRTVPTDFERRTLHSRRHCAAHYAWRACSASHTLSNNAYLLP